MLEKSFTILFYQKKPKNYGKGVLPIYLRLTVNGIPKELSMKRSWDPNRWNRHSSRPMGTKEDAKELNEFLDVVQVKIYEAPEYV